MTYKDQKQLHNTPKQSSSPSIRRAVTSIADNAIAWRKLRGLTQVQVADRAGISTRTVQRFETGDGSIAVETLLQIFRALGILDTLPRATDPYETDIGRLSSEEHLPQRVRPKNLAVSDG